MPSHVVKCELVLDPLPDGAPYIIMPATFGEGMRGPFSIGVNTDAPCDFSLLSADATSAPARQGGSVPFGVQFDTGSAM